MAVKLWEAQTIGDGQESCLKDLFRTYFDNFYIRGS